MTAENFIQEANDDQSDFPEQRQIHKTVVVILSTTSSFRGSIWIYVSGELEHLPIKLFEPCGNSQIWLVILGCLC